MSRFDEVIDRDDTDCIKWDLKKERNVPGDAVSMWVADMDFRVPEGVQEALLQRVNHGIFGYTEVKQSYYEAVCKWYTERFGVTMRPEWIIKTPGVVFAICAAIRAFTKPGDAILIQEPVYYPFAQSIVNNGREVVNNELIYEHGTYHIDFADFEEKIIQQEVKLFILCSPHNPVGRVWTKAELEQLVRICLKHHVFMVSDEIHCDFTYEGVQHTMLTNLSKEAAENCMVCTAPSKTFNLAGLQVSTIFIPEEKHRKQLAAAIARTGYDECNTMGLTACRAAYEGGGAWLDELKEYLAGNLTFIRNFLREKLPQLHLVEPEGTYLVWIDFSALGKTDEELDAFVLNDAKLWLDGGKIFGEASGQFQRFNIACPLSTVQRAFQLLYQAITADSGKSSER